MSSDNGLIGAQAYRKPGVPYYQSDVPNPVIAAPILIEPVSIKSQDLTTTATLFVDGAAAGGYQGAINIVPGLNATATQRGDGVTVRTIAGTGAGNAATTVEIGANAQGPNRLYIAGLAGVGEVYDEVYNQPINSTAVASSTGSLPITTVPRGFAFSYTPTKTGAYMLQVNVNIRNADAIPLDGFIEWVLSDGAEVQYASSTLNSNQLIKVVGMDEINGVPGGIPEPTDFTFSNLCFLTAGVPVSLSIVTARNSTVGGLSWAIQNYDARLIQCC